MRRRTALGLLAGAASLPRIARSGVRDEPDGPAFDRADARHVALALRKLAYSLDGRTGWWWLTGTGYGVAGSTVTRFWDMHVGSWFTTRDLGGDDYEVTAVAVMFYTPPGGTAMLEQFANPYTGRSVEVPSRTPRAVATRMTLRGVTALGAGPSGTKRTFESTVGPAWLEGDEVIVRSDLTLHSEPPERGRRAFTVNDMSTYVGRVRDVMDPKVASAPAAHVFNDLVDFPAWLQMGDRAGAYFSRCWGRKVQNYEQMPATWRAHFETKHPELANDPGALLRA